MSAFSALRLFFTPDPAREVESEPVNHPLDFQDTQADEQMVDLFALDPEWVCVTSSQPLAIALPAGSKPRR